MAANAVSGAVTSAISAAVAIPADTPASGSLLSGVHAAPQSAATTGNSSDVDSEVQSNRPLFLNFTAELAPFNASRKQKRKSNVYKVSGVNILNRNSVDSKTALERLQRRRENHNFVERRRRDNINHTITSLSTLIPYCSDDGVKLNKGNILHMAVEYIRDLQDINSALTEENTRLGGTVAASLPDILNQQRERRLAASSANSDIDTMPHSQDEDEMDDGNYSRESPLLSSVATSPCFAPTTTNTTNVNSVASSRASSSSALSSAGGSTKNSGGAKRGGGNGAAAKRGKKRNGSTSVAADGSKSGNGVGNNNDVALTAACEKKILLESASASASASSWTATPTAVPSANVSPIALGAPQVPTASQKHRNSYHGSRNSLNRASLGSPRAGAGSTTANHLMPPLQLTSAQSVPHSPVLSGFSHSYSTSTVASGAHTPLPSIGSIAAASGGRLLESRIVSPSLATQHQQQHQLPSLQKSGVMAGGGVGRSVGPGRIPAQSMPSSPTLKSFRHHPGSGTNIGISNNNNNNNNGPQQHEGNSAGGAGTWHGSGSSVRTQSAFNMHPFFSSDVSSVRHYIQQQQQQQQQTQLPAYRQPPVQQHQQQQQQQQRVYLGAQSLQNTPLMRPSRESVFNDGFELPSIHPNSESAANGQK